MNKIIILGAGISGISCGYHLKEKKIESITYEKNSSWGGLCDNFEINGFRFDKFIHLSFTKNEYVKELFTKNIKFKTHIPDPVNYYKGIWLKHPAQNNLFELNVDAKVKILKDFSLRKTVDTKNIKNYEEWLRAQYGDYFAENFPMEYTKKYWTVKASKLETKWVGSRMYQPNIDEVLRGAMTDATPNTYYAKEMRYPQKGGYKEYLNYMVKDLDINLNKEAICIDTKNKLIKFIDGTNEKYIELISSIPLSKLCEIIKDIPSKVFQASKKLKWTSGALISLGFNKSNIPKNLWFYIYDKEIKASRIYSPSMKSSDNVPKGCSSMQAEIYFSKENPLDVDLNELLESEIKNYIQMGLFKEEDLIVKDIRVEKYANIIFDHEIYKNRKIVHDYLDKIGVGYIGRFGEWDYLWSDQSLLSGKRGAEDVIYNSNTKI